MKIIGNALFIYFIFIFLMLSYLTQKSILFCIGFSLGSTFLLFVKMILFVYLMNRSKND